MKIKILVVGRLKEKYFREAEAEYRKRLRPYCTLEVVELKNEEALLSAIPERSTVIALDERGPSPTSVEFAEQVLRDEQMRGGGRTVVFAIGGADGHSKALRKRADRLISFGHLTIAHRLVRLLLVEQIYRGFRIVNNQPYHRD